MLISLSRRFVFISNTKTASTSFEQVLEQYAEIRERGVGRKHMPWSETRTAYSFLFDHPDYRPESFFRFGVIRDPLAWFVSWYNFRLGSKGNAPLPADTTFEAFWKMDDWVKFRKDGRKHLQKDQFVDADGTCGFDLVLPMDMLRDYEALLFARLGVEESLPKSNRSRSRMTVADVPPAMQDEIRAFWAEDYAFIEQMRQRVRESLCGVQVDTQPPTDAAVFARVDGAAALCVGQPFDLRGVVVPAESVAADATLELRKGGRVVPVTWGLPSAAVAKKFPANPRAAQARFLLEGIRLDAGDRAELVLAVPGQEARVIASLAASAPGDVRTPSAG